MTRTRLSRRTLLGMAGAALLAPARSGAAPVTTDRKLLVLLCQGGWDPTRLFNPAFGVPGVSMEDDAEPWTIGSFTLVDSPARPTVRSWFEAWHDKVAIVDGMEVRSITHERCLRLLLTGNGASAADDWGSVLAASGFSRALPYLVLSGPAYNARYSGMVVRVGDDRQLPDLLDGTALPDFRAPSDTALAARDALLRARLARMSGTGSDGRVRDGYLAALDGIAGLRTGTLDLSGRADSELCGGVAGQIGTAIDAFAGDHARCALIQYGGNCGPNWDQHSDIGHQSASFEELFQHLDLLTDALSSTTGVTGAPLLDEVTVLVCSEMGRHPALNVQGGKDHWTYTSCLLFGAGVRGGVHVGGYDDTAFGVSTDLATGEESTSGVSLLPSHLGATLLALGDVDPALAGADPIAAVMA